MNTTILGFLAETSIHPGTGRSMGVVDLPVAREAGTDYPVLVGSSLKGALRDKAERKGLPDVDRLFGEPDHAGDLLVSDGRLLLLPVRSLTSAYRWVTCPHILERFRRDLARVGQNTELHVPKVELHSVLSKGEKKLFLEEREFTIRGECPADVVSAIEPVILHEDTRKRLPEQIAVLHDDDCAWFVRYGLSVQARNVLDDKTKRSENLWYEETLPPDTVMYAVVSGRNGDAVAALNELFPSEDPYLQAGGNETVGQGWFAVANLRGMEDANHDA